MKKIVIFGAIAFLSLAAVVGCGNSGSANKKMEEREQALSESIRIKELAARVDRLDSTIAAYNNCRVQQHREGRPSHGVLCP